MEGVSSEAGSLAGHLGLGKLVYLYDANDVSLDGPTSVTFTEDVGAALRGLRLARAARSRTATPTWRRSTPRSRPRWPRPTRPSLIVVRTTIGYGSPNKAGTADAHGAPLGAKEAAATKQALGWPYAGAVHRARTRSASASPRSAGAGCAAQQDWMRRLGALQAARPGARGAGALDARRPSCRRAGTRRCRPGSRATRWRRATRREPVLNAIARAPPGADRRRRRPLRLDQDADQGERRLPGRDAGRAQHPLRRARARDGGDRQRHRLPRRPAPLRRDLPRLRRLHARPDPPRGARPRCTRSTSSRTTRWRSARTARRTSRSSSSPRCARSRDWSCCGRPTPTRPPPRGAGRSAASKGPAALVLTRQKLPVLPGTQRMADEGVAARGLRAGGDRGRSAAGDPAGVRLRGPAGAGGARAARGGGGARARRLGAEHGELRRRRTRPTGAPCCRRRSPCGSRSRPGSRCRGTATSATAAARWGSSGFGHSAPGELVLERYGFTAGAVAGR